MKSMSTRKLKVNETEISVVSVDEVDYISLTDMADGRNNDSRAADVIKNWLRNRYTLEFLGTWEMLNNPKFKVVEFDHFKKQAGLPSFVLSASEWIEKTNAVGLFVIIALLIDHRFDRWGSRGPIYQRTGGDKQGSMKKRDRKFNAATTMRVRSVRVE